VKLLPLRKKWRREAGDRLYRAGGRGRARGGDRLPDTNNVEWRCGRLRAATGCACGVQQGNWEADEWAASTTVPFSKYFSTVQI
jgi:hypothetical protein